MNILSCADDILQMSELLEELQEILNELKRENLNEGVEFATEFWFLHSK